VEGRAISRATENTGFVCEQCGAIVAPLRNGGYRNHCPVCLYSKHLDVQPGDRAATCRALMEPVALEHSSKKGFLVVHRCRDCGATRRNRLADGTDLIDLLVEVGLFKSKGEARRTINGVAVNAERVEEGRQVSTADLLHDRWVLLRKGKTYHLVEAAS